ncbi:hypothetical protein BHM03_00044020, partial [Ensete ventricosum]
LSPIASNGPTRRARQLFGNSPPPVSQNEAVSLGHSDASVASRRLRIRALTLTPATIEILSSIGGRSERGIFREPQAKALPGGGGDRAVAGNAAGGEQLRLRGLQQGVPAGSEPPDTPPGAQPALELRGEEGVVGRGGGEGEAAGVRVPGGELRVPRPVPGARGPHGDQEALQPEARGEEVGMRVVLQEVRRPGGLEGALQDLWHPGVRVPLWHPLRQVNERLAQIRFVHGKMIWLVGGGSRKDSLLAHQAACEATTTTTTAEEREAITVNRELLFPSLWGRSTERAGNNGG